jgi:peptide/nickel transport system substrate-binding protein
MYNIRDYAAAGTALRSRQMDLLYFARPNAGEEYVRSTPELKTMRWPALSASGFSFNMTKPPFTDVRVRQAFALAWDPDNVGTAVAGRGGYKLEGLFPSGLGDWAIPRDELPYQKRDVNRARQLLAEAGVASGSKFMMSIGWYPLGKTVGEVMQQDLRAAGIELELVPSPDRNAELQLVQDMKWDISWNGYTLSTSPALEPDEIVYGFHTKSPTNFAGRGTPEIDRLIEEQRRTLDRAKRKAILLDIQKRLADRVEIVRGPAIHYYALWWPHVRNYEHDYRSFTGDFQYCWLDK